MRKLTSLLFLLVLTIFFTSACKKPIKLPKIVAKTSVKKPSKYAPLLPKVIKTGVGISIIAGAYLITDKILQQDFASAKTKPVITPSIYNHTVEEINILVNSDGKKWGKKKLKPREKVDITSSEKGIIGLKLGEYCFKLDDSKDFIIEEKNEELVLENN